ncbi:hypothetical protein MMC10_006409 [Thelotrema lepadinum]|nr:hypothetical protein [Thelotrema lepadinum]
MNTPVTIEELEAMPTTVLMDKFGFNTPDNDRWAREDPRFERTARTIILDGIAQRGCCAPELPSISLPVEDQASKDKRIKKMMDEWCPTDEQLKRLIFEVGIMNTADRWLEDWRRRGRPGLDDYEAWGYDQFEGDKTIKQEVGVYDQSEGDKYIKQEITGIDQSEGDKHIKQEDDDGWECSYGS